MGFLGGRHASDDFADDERPRRKSTASVAPAVKGALEDIALGVALVDDIEAEHEHTWERGEVFLTDVRSKLLDVKETILQTGRISTRQQSAIDNWVDGIRRWHPDHKDH